MRPAEDQLGGGDRPDPWFLEQAGGGVGDQPGDLVFVAVGVTGCAGNATGIDGDQGSDGLPRAGAVYVGGSRQ